MPRGSLEETLLYDPEIEKTSRKNRAAAKRAHQAARRPREPTPPPEDKKDQGNEGHEEQGQFENGHNINMVANGNAVNGNADDNRTLRQLVFPANMNLRPMGITLPAVTQNWDIHANFIQILPKFHGMPREDP